MRSLPRHYKQSSEAHTGTIVSALDGRATTTAPCQDVLKPEDEARRCCYTLWLLLFVVVVERFYIALFSAFEQTLCARM